METVQAVAQHAEAVLGKEGFRYVSTMVANCKMLALELEEQAEDASTLDMEALIIAGYLHNISTVAYGYYNHHLKSAEMAAAFLRGLDVPTERINKVEQAILRHTSAISVEEHESVPRGSRSLRHRRDVRRFCQRVSVRRLRCIDHRLSRRDRRL